VIRFGEKEHEIDLEERMRFRRVFNNPDGKKVFSIILSDLQHFEVVQPDDVAANALKDYAVTLLERIGAFHEDNLESLTEAYFQVNTYHPPENRDENKDWED